MGSSEAFGASVSSPLLLRIDQAVEIYGDQPAILTETHQFTHAEVQRLSLAVAVGLQLRGVRKGDRIALYAHNGPEFVVLYLGIVRSGAVVVPVNLLIQTPEIAHILSDSGVVGILTQRSLESRIKDALSPLANHPFVVTLDESPDIHENLNPLCSCAAAFESVRFSPCEDLLAILYTSGTTGFPKGAMLTHANLAANTESVHHAMAWQSGRDRVLVVLPMFHAFAATVGLLTPLTNGSALIPLARFEPDTVSHAIAAHQATIFLGVPSMYAVLLKLADDRVSRFASLRFAISGGAAMPVKVMEAFELKFRTRIYEGDGPTECSPVTCVNPINGIQKPGTVGLPVPGVEMQIVDEDGQVCPSGVVGEIAVRGANVMKGYWNQPEATKEVMQNGWLLTGDLGLRDEDGYFSIVDRKKDLIIVNGMNVYPRMIEEMLLGISGIREVAVVGEIDDRHGEVPVAYVALEPGSEWDGKKLRDYCRQCLGRHQIPKRFVVLDQLPRNAAGKILKRELRQQGERERGVVLPLARN
jgi:long-chain acyl-CoA synthetase